jgi:hypothetical protein
MNWRERENIAPLFLWLPPPKLSLAGGFPYKVRLSWRVKRFGWPLSLLLEASRLVFRLWMEYDERVAENTARAAFNNPT